MQLGNTIQLQFSLTSRLIAVSVMNKTPRSLNLWDLENSWGWYAFAVTLTRDPKQAPVLITRRERDWTKNGPSTVTLPGSGRWDISLDLNDGWWNIPQSVNAIRDGQLHVRVTYEVNQTPEADKFDVVTGTAESDPIISTPPHPWLPILPSR